MSQQSHYERLGVDNTASEKEVRKAYRSLLMSSTDSGDLDAIERAYEILANSSSRADYDKSLDASSSKPDVESSGSPITNAKSEFDPPPETFVDSSTNQFRQVSRATNRKTKRQRRAPSPIISIILGGIAAVPVSVLSLKYFADVDVLGLWQKSPQEIVDTSSSSPHNGNANDTGLQSNTVIEAGPESNPPTENQNQPESATPYESETQSDTESVAKPASDDQPETGSEPQPESEPKVATRFTVPDVSTQDRIRLMAGAVFEEQYTAASSEEDPVLKKKSLLELSQKVFDAAKSEFPLDDDNADSRYVLFDSAYKLAIQSDNKKFADEIMNLLTVEYAIEDWEIRLYAIEFWYNDAKRSPVPLIATNLETHFRLFQLASFDAGSAYSAGADGTGEYLLMMAKSLLDLIKKDNFKTTEDLKELNATYIKIFQHMQTLDRLLVQNSRADISYECITIAREIAVKGQGAEEQALCDERLKVLTTLKEFDRKLALAKEIIKTDPANAGANLTLGIALMRKGLIPDGLTCLTFAGHKRLEKIASDDLNLTNAVGDTPMIKSEQELAMGWLELYENPDGIDLALHDILRVRALFWLNRVANTYNGFEKLNIQKRIKELEISEKNQ
tara:strand:+ start:484 stop:2340 length:1857 start_codon:yes stop_codon:yes gene_type:complete